MLVLGVERFHTDIPIPCAIPVLILEKVACRPCNCDDGFGAGRGLLLGATFGWVHVRKAKGIPNGTKLKFGQELVQRQSQEHT